METLQNENFFFHNSKGFSKYYISENEVQIINKRLDTEIILAVSIIRQSYLGKTRKESLRLIQIAKQTQTPVDKELLKNDQSEKIPTVIIKTTDNSIGYFGIFHFTEVEFPVLFINEANQSRATITTNSLLELSKVKSLPGDRPKEKERTIREWKLDNQNYEDCKNYLIELLREIDIGDNVYTSKAQKLANEEFPKITIDETRKILKEYASESPNFKFIRIKDLIRRV